MSVSVLSLGLWALWLSHFGKRILRSAATVLGTKYIPHHTVFCFSGQSQRKAKDQRRRENLYE